MRELPSGTVTLLFTDIEGSTRLLHEHGERYAELLSEHRRALRDAFAQHGGVEVDTQGDAFFVAFARASDALAAARDGQAGLAGGPIRVRMGVHTGEPLVSDEGYVGIDVHRAARIAAAGHGGQVLVSQSTRDLAADAELRDLGEHRLKDLSAPGVWQLGTEQFPPLKTLYQTNLPVPATPFLGRAEELEAVAELLARADVRLLTLIGAGGTGKTRLALQAAGGAADDYPHGVWWVPLAPVPDASGVLPAVGRALGGGDPADAIRDRRLLLVVDNFEHLVDAASDVGALVAACPRLDVLATSRERLRVQGEHAYAVPVLARSEARRLFVERARATDRFFEPDASVDEICARLDDLPLALELAAARTSLLSTEQLLERLGRRLDLLRGGRDAEARQRTLRATIEWSYDLLGPDEQRLLAALSVFRGGWTLDAAEAVCDADVELLESLADKSLVRRWEANRFGMLETIREFAAERLEAAQRERLLRRLLEHLMELAEAAHLYEEANAPHRPELVLAERANVDVALSWALDAHEIGLGLRLLWLLELYWGTNDPLAGRRWVDAFLERADDTVEPVLRARALRLRGAMFDMTGRSDLAEAEYVRALELFRELAHDDAAGHVINRRAWAALQAGDFERAEPLAWQALEDDRRRGHRRDEALALGALGAAALALGRGDEGVRLLYESATLAEEVGFLWWSGGMRHRVAEWLADRDPDEAERALLRALETIVSINDRVNMPAVLMNAARIAAARGDLYRAGMFWGALLAGEGRELVGLWSQAREELEAQFAALTGEEFERGIERGRALSLTEALDAVRSPID